MKTTNKIIKNIQQISLELGRTFFGFDTLSLETSEEEKSQLFYDEKVKNYYGSVDVDSKEIKFIIEAFFSIHSAKTLAISKLAKTDDDILEDMALDSLGEFLNVLAGLFKTIFKYPETFSFIGIPSIIPIMTPKPDSKELISRWMLSDSLRNVTVEFSLLCYPKNSEVMRKVVVDHFKNNIEIDTIQIL
ncbi:MAG: hypothetical protein HQK54_13600 [Oligoflexales bacterium]|nr:hypothetical protein [Oligoflexales bacterium]